MRALLPSTALLLCLLSAGCAGKREVRPPGAIQKVAVVVGSRIDTLPAYSYRQDLVGEGNPRSVLVSQAESALEDRGFEVVARRISASPYPPTEEVVQFIQQNGAQAAVVVVLDWLDVSGAQTQGVAVVSLDTILVSPAGEVVWRNATQTQHPVGLLSAQTGVSSYLRKAVIQAIRQVP